MRIVVKVGSSTLTHATGQLNIRRVETLCKVMSDLKNAGHEMMLVSSGAIAMGLGKLSLKERPQDIPTKQATAAVGQCAIMHLYDQLFSEYNVTAAQILLTGEDIGERERAENLHATFSALLSMGVIPVVNENDSVSSAELETAHYKVLGDNDTLSALVASLVDADLLILLSDIDGLYNKNPREYPDAKLIHTVTELTDDIKAMAGGTGTWRGTGGMVTKLSAAELAMKSGFDMVITNGSRVEDIYDIVDGLEIGTRFIAKEEKP